MVPWGKRLLLSVLSVLIVAPSVGICSVLKNVWLHDAHPWGGLLYSLCINALGYLFFSYFGWVGSVPMTLPSECVSLSRPCFEDKIHPRRRRGGGNVGIGLIDFQGLWEGRKTALSFSGLSINRHFHGLLRSPRTVMRRSSLFDRSSLVQTASG
jgi:hypothetical protein